MVNFIDKEPQIDNQCGKCGFIVIAEASPTSLERHEEREKKVMMNRVVPVARRICNRCSWVLVARIISASPILLLGLYLTRSPSFIR